MGGRHGKDYHQGLGALTSGSLFFQVSARRTLASDLHLFDGLMPTMQEGDVLGHEPMGVVEEVGKGVTKMKKGDHIVIPFTISCGRCWFCQRQMYSLCDPSNPNAEMARKVMGPIAGRAVRLLAHAAARH